MRKFLLLGLLFSSFACSPPAEINQALHQSMSLKRQEMLQEHQIYQLDYDSLGLEFKNWNQRLKKKFPDQNPIIEEHQKSLEAYSEIFKKHQNQLTEFQDALEVFTKILERHALGKTDDQELQTAHKRLSRHFEDLKNKHLNLLENHQTLKDAYESLIGEYQEKKK